MRKTVPMTALAGGSVFLLLAAFMYHSTTSYLLGCWGRDDFTYSYFIPPMTAYLIWEQRARLSATPSLPDWRGLLPALGALLLYWLGELGGEFTVMFLSFWLLCVAALWSLLGLKRLRLMAFPLLFSLTMVPPPNMLYGPLTFRLKLISSQMGVKLMQLYGLSAFREGNVIDLGFTQLQVVDACSGLRYFFPLIVMAMLLAHYHRGPFWQKLVVVLSAIPVSIVANSLRIASVGVLYPIWGAAVAEGFFHDFSGWFIFMVSLAILGGEMWVLRKFGRQESEVRSQKTEARRQEAGDRRQETEGSSQEAEGALAWAWRPLLPFLLILLLMGASAIGASVKGGAGGSGAAPLKPLSGFPLQLGAWQGTRSAMEQQFLDALKLTDYALVDYRDQGGREVNLYVAFNASQRKGEATHSPATCLPGSGWEFSKAEVVLLPLADGRSIRINRAFMEKSGARQLVYYWFPQRGRILTNLYQVKLYNFWDALTRQRTDGALVRIITPVYGTEGAEASEQRLRGVTREIVPLLEGFLPN